MFAYDITWQLNAFVLVLGASAIACAIGLAGWAWWRSGRDRWCGVLELMRVTLVTMAVVTLWQPEWRESHVPQERPTLVVLSDRSDSMTTRDVIGASNSLLTTRAAWAESCAVDPMWDEIGRDVRVVRETFAGLEGGTDGTDLQAGLAALPTQYDNLRAVVLLSDGSWNTGGSPTSAAAQYRTRKIAILPVAVGSETALPDVEVMSLEPPSYAVAGKSLQVPFALRSLLPVESTLSAELTVAGQVIAERTVRLPAHGELRDALMWTPAETGEFELTLHVAPHPEELTTENNTQRARVEVREESLRVLIVEAEPRWEYRYLRNALDRDPGVEVSCLLFHPDLVRRGGGSGYLDAFPADPESLSQFDVIFLGDVGTSAGQLTPAECRSIKAVVEQQATGLILMPGRSGRQFELLATELATVYPVVLDGGHVYGVSASTPSRFVLTESGRRSLLTQLADDEEENSAIWQNLPGFQWHAPALRSKAGTVTLALEEVTRTPLLVTRPFGTGKILFLGTDSAWRWREGVEDKYHYRFWGQVVRWMAYQRNMAESSMLRMFYAPDRPTPRSVVTLHATVLDPSGRPLPEATLVATITDPDGAAEELHFESGGTEWGLYDAQFQPTREGGYAIRLECQETEAVLETAIDVRGEEVEKTGQPVDRDILVELASLTGGELLSTENWHKVKEHVLSMPTPEPLTTRHRLWAHPIWILSTIGLLGAFWVGRKLQGTI
ncbi:MAG: hypothetical protein KDA60_13115 [Planctomycetales bacterium]|nr:hypothetical protein [Planctomycetales bacterium]